MAVLPSLFSTSMLGFSLLLTTFFSDTLIDSAPDQKRVTESRNSKAQNSGEAGAWRLVTKGSNDKRLTAGATAVKIVSDGYFTVAYYDLAGKKFLGTYGGTYTLSNNQLQEYFDFNTLDSTQVGTTAALKQTMKNGRLQISGTRAGAKVEEVWEKIDESNVESPLQGTWRITGRAGDDGSISKIQRGPRKTLKILSGTRFQWIAINTETKQFFGTGGGTYTTKDGKYTETIEFFSRDPKRVGASLTFDFEVKDGARHHSGLSSSGNKIYEIWERELAE